MNFELEAAFVSEPFTAPGLEARPVFEEQLVLVTSKAIRKVSGPADLGRSTLIAFAQGCSYRKRIEEWLGGANVMPERVLEFASYQAMIACVAAGTGFAVVPKSVLEALRATRSIRQHPLPKRFSHNRTYHRVEWRSLAVAARPDVAFGTRDASPSQEHAAIKDVSA